LQQLTHALSHTFSRATRGVSLVPPAYCEVEITAGNVCDLTNKFFTDADLACERGRCYIHGLLNATDAASAALGNSSDASAVFAAAQKIWMSGPGAFVKERMFYI
jgi:eukaryotic translation initiation factor 2C